MTQWLGSFVFGHSMLVFRGRTADNSAHAHASIQLSVAQTGDLVILDAEGSAHTAPGLITRPGHRHVLQPAEAVTLVHIEPQLPLANTLLAAAGDAGTSLLAPAITEALRQAATLDDCLAVLTQWAPPRNLVLDPRIAQALDWLVGATASDAIAQAAAMCGVSDSRLRTLARESLGTSLSQWLTWRKLEVSGRAMLAGAPLAEVAYAGGFADQAHFTRTMRKVFGITPHSASRIVRRI
ncbi:MAG: helix-turn-helix domain-containing protein [Pseudomonadota bacterium]